MANRFKHPQTGKFLSRAEAEAMGLAVSGPSGGYSGPGYEGYIPSVGYGGVPGKPYPDMPNISERAPKMEEYGAPGTAIFSGIITSEEYNPDLYWREAVRIYDQMRRNDYQIMATLLLMELPIRGAEWKVEPASDQPIHIEQASLIETALFHELEQPWDDVLRQALLMLPFGFMVFEKVWKVGDDSTVYWSKFAPRLPRTIWRWWIDEQNELQGVQQWTFKNWTYEFIDIPAKKLLVFSHRMEGNNFEGISVLRTAYKPWYYKEALLRIMAIGFEREHVGVPIIKLPPNHTTKDVDRAATIGKNLRANEQSYVTLPNGWEMDWLQGKQGGRSSSHTPILDAIGHMDVAIARNVLGQFINLGSGETGTYALSSDQSSIFLMSLQAVARYIETVFTHDAIPQLVKYNFPDPGVYPKLVARRIQSFDFESLSNAIANLVRMGAMTVTPELQDFLYDLVGLPKPPQNLVESTLGQQGAGGAFLGGPFTPDAIQQRQQRDDQADMQKQQYQDGRKDTEFQQEMQKAQFDEDKNERRSKGPGQDSTVTTSDAPTWLPDGDAKDALRRMQPTQRAIYLRMLNEAARRHTYALADNRVEPMDSLYRRRVDAITARLKTNYRRVEASLLDGAPRS